MRYYELIYIINSNVERKKVDQVMKDIGAKLENTNSKLIVTCFKYFGAKSMISQRYFDANPTLIRR